MSPLPCRASRTRRPAGALRARPLVAGGLARRLVGRFAGRVAALCALGAGLAAAACSDPAGPGSNRRSNNSVPRVGDVLRINTQSDVACTSPTYRGGRVVAVSERAVVVADTTNPAGGFTDAEYASIAATFDTLVYPVDTRAFGVPEDIDGNGRVIIFYTSAVNELTPRSVEYIIGGFFISRDLFPRADRPGFQGCAGSNEGELFYLLVPDPTGTINGNPRSKSRVLTTSLSTVAHEFQHLINASRRLYVLNQQNYNEEVWLNEGLSHIAEEINFFESAGLSPSGREGQSPRSDLGSEAFGTGTAALTALNAYNGANLGRLSAYLRAVQDSTALGVRVNDRGEPDDDGLATRGAAWGFLRYAADRLNGNDAEFFSRLVNGTTLGLRNLRAALGTSAPLESWMRDWSVANVADNLVPGAEDRFQYKSWDFRSLLPRVSGNNSRYPLAVNPLGNGAARTDSIAGGTAAYYTFSLAPGGSATVRTRGPGGAAPESAVRLSLVRLNAPEGAPVTTYEAGAGADIALTNTSTVGVSYVLVAFNANLDNPRAKQTLTVDVTGPGTSVFAGAALLRADRQGNLEAVQPGPTIAGVRALEALAQAPYAVTDLPLQERFRRQSQQELARLVPGAQAWLRERRGR